jgi:hypothetical protein
MTSAMQMPFRRQPDARDALDAIGNQTDALGQMIERELAQYVPKANGLPPLELVPREGRVGEDELKAEFEKTSQAVADMGAALEGLARANDETSHYIRECVEYVAKLAAHYQSEGVKIANEIGQRRELAEEVRRQCDALMAKLNPTRESRE